MSTPMLSPRTGGRSIAVTALQPADLIVSTTNAAISRAIRAVSASVVSHAMIYAGNGFVIEAIGSGVVKRPLEVAVGGASLAVAYRHGRITNARAYSIVNFHEQQINRGYDFTGIIGQAGYQLDRWYLCRILEVPNCESRAQAANLWMSSGGRFFCSELVASAYSLAGIPLIDARPDSVSPQTIVEVAVSGALQYIGHLVS